MMECHDLMKNRDKKHISDGQLSVTKRIKRKLNMRMGKQIKN